MDRADRAGLAVAAVGHLALLAALSIGLAWRVPPVKPVQDVMDVQLVDAVGLKSAAPEPATEAPQQAEAPEAGPPAEAPPPPAQQPTPAPPPKPAPVKPPEPKSDVPPPKPVPPKPEPAKPQKAPEKPAAKPAPAKSLTDILKDVRSSAKSEQASAAKSERAAGAKLGPDFLKGVLSASAGKGEKARASINDAAMNGLAAAIKRQVQPCYDLGGLGGTPAMQIVTVLQLRFNPDGSVAGAPQLVEQQGVNDGNRAYAKQMIEVSRRAILRCAPLKLPAEMYSGGWENITMGFTPGQMQ
ncbi:hypothetical protein [Sphingomonas nostoxanthinifaciens]|uniref:hypothetical protein n=1 Tax=Sphingomonas nostoxanthinifaciens TaxID=2872652 RepID=UPI001CC1FE9B|nr:hypothetical protein [Sphingomonas nostoxanthinifaciens]UAK26311.1 hypothetical protein K8P63_09595 [Sphingomonas nostoxanthinifaciens]